MNDSDTAWAVSYDRDGCDVQEVAATRDEALALAGVRLAEGNAPVYVDEVVLGSDGWDSLHGDVAQVMVLTR